MYTNKTSITAVFCILFEHGMSCSSTATKEIKHYIAIMRITCQFENSLQKFNRFYCISLLSKIN